jgi:hypothetical protein
MAKYFSKFPKVYYNLNGNQNVDVVTNILSRFKMSNHLKQYSAAYYNYNIIDGETPEIISAKVYNEPERHWVILFMNDIVDPQWDWPLTFDVLNTYIENKYSAPEYADTANTSNSGIEWAKDHTKSYYKVETIQTSNGSTEEKIELALPEYNNVVTGSVSYTLSDNNVIDVVTTKETKNYYDYELDLNESKRIIKILKSEFVDALEQELKRVLNA